MEYKKSLFESYCFFILQALLFRDWNTFSLIMKVEDPKVQKKLGRAVTPYKDDAWR